MTATTDSFEALRSYGLSLPETVEEFLWGHSALKVRKKTFVFLHQETDVFNLSVKLPVSRDFALIFDFAEPTGYGLGRSGWVTAQIGAGEQIDLDLLKRWIAESCSSSSSSPSPIRACCARTARCERSRSDSTNRKNL